MENREIARVNKIFKCDFLSIDRKQNNVDGRAALAYYLLSEKKYSFSEIGKLLKKDRTTIYNLVKRHFEYFETDKEYKKKYLKLLFEKEKIIYCKYCKYETIHRPTKKH